MVVFDRPIGAQADANELEFISALHQSGPRLRPDGSIRDEDIKVFLRSRFGIEVSLEEVRQTILQGLGGSDDQGEVIDLMELTAIIIIPLLLKAAAVAKGQALPPDVLPPPEKLLNLAVKIITHDVSGSEDTSQTLSPEFIRQMLTIYGETEMAQDEGLIRDMIHAASGTTDKAVEFNVLSFAEGLTHDVRLYDISNEVRISTSIQDVFYEHESSEAEVDIPGTSVEELEVHKPSVRQIETLRHIYTAPAIDIQAGTYRSKALTVCLWGAVLFGNFQFVLFVQNSGIVGGDCGDYDSEAGWVENVDAIICQLSSTIFGWFIIFLLFSFLGLFSMGMGSIGNYTGHTRWYLPLIGATYMVIRSSASFALTQENQGQSYLQFMSIVSLILNAFTAYFHLCHFVAIVFRKVDFERSMWGRRLGLATLGRESSVKKAGAHKLNNMMENAAKLMQGQRTSSVFKTYFGHGLSSFTVNGVSKEKTGGVFWLWRKIRDNSIFENEGIWYSTRLVASNFAQLCVSLFILLLGISVIREVKENYGKEEVKAEVNAVVDHVIETKVSVMQTSAAATELLGTFTQYLATAGLNGLLGYNCPATSSDGLSSILTDLCSQDEFGNYNCSGIESSQESLCVIIQHPNLAELDPAALYELMEVSGFNTSALEEMVQAQLQGTLNDSVESLYPEEEYMIVVPLCIGLCLAIMAAFRLAILYLPGVTVTILELRSGVIPSLHSPDFQKYREAPDTVTLLTGTLFWGCLVSSILFGLLIGFIIFLFLWQGSYYFMMRIFATLLGVLCVVLIRLVLVMFCCRRSFYKGLYRTRPAGANISLLALEWANFFFTAAFILVRMFKILLIAASSIGHIDRKLLADGVGQLGPVEFDPYPTIHVRDLVAHEAHRHPFVEILGTMYLMKLRYAKHFGSRAGSAWRLIFIYALLPWMHQYRILGDDPNKDDYLNSGKDAGDLQNSALKAREVPLPVLAEASTTDARALEIENEKLKKMVKKLNRRLQELQGGTSFQD